MLSLDILVSEYLEIYIIMSYRLKTGLSCVYSLL